MIGFQFAADDNRLIEQFRITEMELDGYEGPQECMTTIEDHVHISEAKEVKMTPSEPDIIFSQSGSFGQKLPESTNERRWQAEDECPDNDTGCAGTSRASVSSQPAHGYVCNELFLSFSLQLRFVRSETGDCGYRC
jgi:hypothetical protein